MSQPADDGRSNSDASGSAKQGFLHVCTDDKVWAVRQMSTSNSVYIARTTSPASSSPSSTLNHEGIAEGHDSAPREDRHALTAFAKPASILELQESSNDGLEIAAGYLRRLIAVWPASSTDSITGITSNTAANTTAHVYTTTSTLLDDIPCSATAIQTAVSLAPLFKIPSGELRIPTQAFLLETWTKIVEISTILDLPFTHDLLHHERFRVCLKTDMGEAGVELTRRILDSRDGLLSALGLMSEQSNGNGSNSSSKNSNERGDSESHNSSASIRYDERGMARWAGRLILQVHLESTSDPKIKTSFSAGEQQRKPELSVTEFMQTWHSTLPASWTRHADLALLEDIIQIRSNDDDGGGGEVVVLLDTDGSASKGMRQQQSNAISKTSSATSKGKRKWHEKFAAQRDGNAKR